VEYIEKALIDIFLPESLCPKANKFWEMIFRGNKFPVCARTGWEDFTKALSLELGQEYGPTQIECLEKLICENDANEKTVSIELFSTLLKWFGKMKGELSIVERLEEAMRMEWFFGTIPANEAEEKLMSHKDKEGTFLVRLNMGGKTLIEKAPFTITRVEAQRVVHTRVYATEGGFLLKIGDDRKMWKSKGSASILRFVDHLLMSEPGMFKKACPGSPYQSIFTKIRPPPSIVYQSNDDDL